MVLLVETTADIPFSRSTVAARAAGQVDSWLEWTSL